MMITVYISTGCGCRYNNWGREGVDDKACPSSEFIIGIRVLQYVYGPGGYSICHGS